LMQQYSSGATESVTICGATKSLAADGKPSAQTTQTLDRAMHQFGRALAPLAECGY